MEGYLSISLVWMWAYSHVDQCRHCDAVCTWEYPWLAKRDRWPLFCTGTNRTILQLNWGRLNSTEVLTQLHQIPLVIFLRTRVAARSIATLTSDVTVTWFILGNKAAAPFVHSRSRYQCTANVTRTHKRSRCLTLVGKRRQTGVALHRKKMSNTSVELIISILSDALNSTRHVSEDACACLFNASRALRINK